MPTWSDAAQDAIAAAFAAAQNTALDNALNLADAGSNATLTVRTGTRPASPDDAATGTALATIVLNDPAFAAAALGEKALDVSPALGITAATNGTPGYARLATSAGVGVADFTVGTTGTEIIASSSPWTTGQQVNLTVLTVEIVTS